MNRTTPNKLLIFLLILIISACKKPDQPKEPVRDDGTSIYYQEGQKPFYHSVASGDPLPDRVIIWTRVTPEYQQEVEVSWSMATDEQLSNVVRSGKTTTGPERDFTIKVDVDGLESGTRYYYQFEALGQKSPVGRTKTAPAEDPEEVQFAIVSCSNFEAGYFNAFARIAERDDIDAVLHLGDYIYEYEVGRYGDTTLGRYNLPEGEIIQLDDYRTRYALYRLDEDFQKAHQMHPFITVWDDHEISNNSFVSGAENHQPGEGDYEKRKAAARQAYYEWLPVRDEPTLYRQFRYGELADLLMLDERLAGRSAPADSIGDPAFRDSTRSMLGEAQKQWLLNNLNNSTATWKVIGNQVIFSDLRFENIFPDHPLNLDAWDGYPYEKNLLIDFIQEAGIQNLIFVSGDTHCSWAFETPASLEAYRQDTTALIAVEFGTTSISSPNYDESTSLDTVRMVENRYQESNPHLKYVNLHDHGYLLLKLTPQEAVAEWWYVESVKKKTKEERLGKRIRVEKEGNELVY